MPLFLLISGVFLLGLGITFFLFWFRQEEDYMIVLTLAFVVGGLCLLASPWLAGSYLAGQGDGFTSAKTWVTKWRPGAAVDCQERDTDDNGYITCTVGWPKGSIVGEVTGPDTFEVEAIECGVNRWFHGYQTRGCRLMKGYSGAQR